MQRLDFSRDWKRMLRNRVHRAVSLHPQEANVFLGWMFVRGFQFPSMEEQERYVTELMRAQGYRFISSQSVLWITMQLTYRRNDSDKV